MKDQPDSTEAVTPAAEPVQAPPAAPAYVPPVAQPVQQWAEAPPVQQQVQYVVAKQSLDGIGGWLMFWLIVFSLNGIGYIIMFFDTLSSGIDTPEKTLLALFAPVLAVGFLASVVLIALRKKIGIIASMATIGVATLHSVINTVISLSSGSDAGSAISVVIVQLVFGGLIILYFVTSKRIKATLIS